MKANEVPRNRTPTVFVIGDSVSLGYGPALQRGLEPDYHYARKGGEEEAFTNLDIPRGANGGDSQMVLAYMRELQQKAFHTDILLLNCGLHDLKRTGSPSQLQVPPDRYRSNLHAILELAVQLANTPVWVNTTPVDDIMHARRGAGFDRLQQDVRDYQLIVDKTLNAHAVPSLPLDRYTASLGAGPDIFVDGVHFKPSVCDQQGAYLAACIKVLVT